MKKSKRASGFTLLELLIALSFFTVAFVVVSSVFGTGITAWRRSEGESAFYQEVRLATERIGLELRNSLPYAGIPFEGEENSFSFLQVRHPRSGPSPEWIRVTYKVSSKEGSAHLIRQLVPFLKGEETEATVLSDLSDIRFSYPLFETDGTWEWKERWDSGISETGPPFMKITLSLKGGEAWEKLFFVRRP